MTKKQAQLAAFNTEENKIDILLQILETAAIWFNVQDFTNTKKPNFNIPISNIKSKKEDIQKKIQRTLVDTDTYYVCTYLMLLFYTKKIPAKLGQLVPLFERGNLTASKQKSVQTKIKSILDRLGGDIDLIRYEHVDEGKKEFYKIYPTEKLIDFYEKNLFSSYVQSVNRIFPSLFFSFYYESLKKLFNDCYEASYEASYEKFLQKYPQEDSKVREVLFSFKEYQKDSLKESTDEFFNSLPIHKIFESPIALLGKNIT